jgi:predicted enzyme related to lactoylglutathione lyase
MTDHAIRFPLGMPWGVSLLVRDLDRATGFYGALFGWEFLPGPPLLGRCVRAVLDGREVAGIGQLPPHAARPASWTPSWTPHFLTADADETAHLVRATGGTMGVGPLDGGAAGRIAVASDPSGAVFGFRRPPRAEAPGALPPGTTAWYELTTVDAELAAKFYATVFGLDLRADDAEESLPSERTLLLAGGQPVAGVRGVGQALPEGRGAHWSVHFAVPDSATLGTLAARGPELGGRVVQPPRDFPYGRLAVLADPEGTVFSVAAAAG